MLGRDHKNEVIGHRDVGEDKRRVGDVGVVADGFVCDLESKIGCHPTVIWCLRQVEDYPSVGGWVWLPKDGLLPNFLLAFHLCELPRLLLCHLSIGWCQSGWRWLHGSNRHSVGLGGCYHSRGGQGSGSGGGRVGGNHSDLFVKICNGFSQKENLLLHFEIPLLYRLEPWEPNREGLLLELVADFLLGELAEWLQ